MIVWLRRAYQNHYVPHVVKLLGVEECCELFSVRCLVSIQISRQEPPLITRKHLLKAELVCCIFKLLWVG